MMRYFAPVVFCQGHKGFGPGGQLIDLAITFLLGVEHGLFAVALQQVGMDLAHFGGLVDRGDVEHGHQAVAAMVTGVHQHLRAAGTDDLQPHCLEFRNLGHTASQLGVRVAAHDFLEHRTGHPQMAVAGQLGHIGNAAGLGVVLERQVQGEARYFFRVLGIGGDNQFDRNAFGAVECLQVQMHFKADGVLINAVQQIARGDFHRTDIAQVIDHELQDLAVDRFADRGIEMAEGGHGDGFYSVPQHNS